MFSASIDNPLAHPVTDDPILTQYGQDRHRGQQEWNQEIESQMWADWRAQEMPQPTQKLLAPNLPTLESRSVDRMDELEQRVAGLENDLKSLRNELAARPVIRSYQLYDLGSATYKLTAPVVIVLEEYPGRYIARLPEFEAVGMGDFEGEAITRLKADIVNLYQDLQREPEDNLDEVTLRWRNVLQKIVCKVQ